MTNDYHQGDEDWIIRHKRDQDTIVIRLMKITPFVGRMAMTFVVRVMKWLLLSCPIYFSTRVTCHPSFQNNKIKSTRFKVKQP